MYVVESLEINHSTAQQLKKQHNVNNYRKYNL